MLRLKSIDRSCLYTCWSRCYWWTSPKQTKRCLVATPTSSPPSRMAHIRRAAPSASPPSPAERRPPSLLPTALGRTRTALGSENCLLGCLVWPVVCCMVEKLSEKCSKKTHNNSDERPSLFNPFPVQERIERLSLFNPFPVLEHIVMWDKRPKLNYFFWFAEALLLMILVRN